MIRRYVIFIYCICILTENPFEMFEMQRNKSAKLQVLKNEKPISMSLYINWYLQFYNSTYLVIFNIRAFQVLKVVWTTNIEMALGIRMGKFIAPPQCTTLLNTCYGLLSEQLNDSVEFGAKRCYIYPDGSVLRPSTSLYFYHCVVICWPIWLHGGSTKFTGCPVHTTDYVNR